MMALVRLKKDKINVKLLGVIVKTQESTPGKIIAASYSIDKLGYHCDMSPK
jgi:hypothetical protein